MKRFDMSESDERPGFEDFCVLQAKAGSLKYKGSYEAVAKSIKLFCSPKWQRASLEQFFKMIVLNTLLQNGDAHLKNFGVIYESEAEVRLAPVYDVVSTTAYIKNDMAALTLAGINRWWPKDRLIEFGNTACQLSRKRAESLHGECVNGMKLMGRELDARLKGTEDADKRALLEHLASLVQAS